ncbi:endonuclease/exonuclease/phosphatase family protein [Portibacter lacus]|nr:endonuclease/exonuclease/phosphatase family protein [Portibacter lacus]
MIRIFYLCILLILVSAITLNASPADSTKLKVLTYNIWNGFDWGKDSVRRESCVNWIKEQNADVVSLQELCGYTDEMLKEDAAKWGHQYSVLLKTSGYPTGITSNKPITLKAKVIKPFWHGLLHCETYGIDFFVVHFSPADSDFRLKETKMVSEMIKNSGSEKYIINGDFNSYSPFDALWIEPNTPLKEKNKPRAGSKHTNLRLGEFDYSAISTILGTPAIDLALNKVDLQDSYTFPSEALDGLYKQTLETIKQNAVRIDYIMASPILAKDCTKVEVYNSGITNTLSDHYPMMAEFKIAE